MIKKIETLVDKENSLIIKTYNGHICGINFKGRDLIHGGGLPKEYRSKEDNLRIENGAPEYSNITVFPFGANPKKVFVGDREIIEKDQHGLSRSLSWKLIESKNDNYPILYVQRHDGKTCIRNVKYSKTNNNPKNLEGMFPFEIRRGYGLIDERMKIGVKSLIEVVNSGTSSFSYELWDHPIFISPKDLNKGILYNTDEDIKLGDIENVKFLDRMGDISFYNCESAVGCRFDSKGFENLMIWVPEGKGIFSIESKTHPGIQSETPDAESRVIEPGEVQTYHTFIKPFI